VSGPSTEAYHALVDVVLDAELARPEGRALHKTATLHALEARRELVDRLSRWRWMAIEDARAAGASWSEIDDAIGAAPGTAWAEYDRVLGAQKRFGLAPPERCDPGLSLA
jgi:hypothetical protein